MKKRLHDILDVVTDELGENCKDITQITIEINDKYSDVEVDVVETAESEFEARKKALIASSFGQDLLPILSMIEMLSNVSDKWILALNSALKDLASNSNANYQLTVVKK